MEEHILSTRGNDSDGERYLNVYYCENCNTEWEEIFDRESDDNCQECGATVSPVTWCEIKESEL